MTDAAIKTKNRLVVGVENVRDERACDGVHVGVLFFNGRSRISNRERPSNMNGSSISFLSRKPSQTFIYESVRPFVRPLVHPFNKTMHEHVLIR